MLLIVSQLRSLLAMKTLKLGMVRFDPSIVIVIFVGVSLFVKICRFIQSVYCLSVLWISSRS